MTINISGLISIILFYAVILAAGIYAAWRQKKQGSSSSATSTAILADRNIGLFVGVLTMTATWVGGGHVNGSAEAVFNSGIAWCQTPIGYSMSLIFGGLFFAKPMRKRGYVTLLDPFQEKFGPRVGGLLFVPALFGDIVWTASILSALGSTLSVILGLDNTVAIVLSAGVAVTYTLIGGMYSVAFTDVLQLFCILCGLVICIPFAWKHPAAKVETLTTSDWLGSVDAKHSGVFIDYYLLLALGGIPYQAYFQRVLSVKSPRNAQILSYAAAVGCTVLAIPSVLIGGIAKSVDWAHGTAYGMNITTPEQSKQILPLVLQYLTPEWVSFLGLGAVSAAVMSSADSCILSASSLFTKNIYKGIFAPQASEKHLMRVMWVSIFVNALLGTGMAVTVNTVYGLSLLCSDLVYVLLFPQLVMVIHWPEYCNTYGSLAAFVVGLILRILGGEPLIGLPAAVEYPFFEDGQQLFPFRTLAMLVSMATLVLVSSAVAKCFASGWMNGKYDFFQCVTVYPESPRHDPVEPGELHLETAELVIKLRTAKMETISTE